MTSKVRAASNCFSFSNLLVLSIAQLGHGGKEPSSEPRATDYPSSKIATQRGKSVERSAIAIEDKNEGRVVSKRPAVPKHQKTVCNLSRSFLLDLFSA